MVARWCSEKTVEEVVEICAREAIACEPVHTYAEAARDPHVLERDMLQPTPQEGDARAPIVGPAAKFSRTPTRVRTGAPALGAHNDEILEALGIDERARRRLKEQGVI